MAISAPQLAVKFPHDEYGPQINALNWSMVAISGGFLGLRIYLKIDRRRSLGWDDYILTLAWLLQTVQVTVASVSIAYGFGKHIWNVPESSFPLLPILGTAVASISLFAASLSKTSFGLTLLRLPIGRLKYLVWAVIIALNVVSCLAAASNWPRCEWTSPGSFCIPIQTVVAYGIFTGVFSAAMDFTLALIPWKVLWKIQMKQSDKIGLMIAMSMGIFAGIASILKALQVHALEGGDLTLGIPLTLWSTAESAVAIVACSIPMLRALLGNELPPSYQGEIDTKLSQV